ncbi:MAG: tripartite tricarboxylate transporter substrate-binding protein [Alcaligenaceae bacterium]
MKKMIALVMTVFGLLFGISSTHAQEFKAPIKFIVPFVPGGATDVLARMIAPKVSAELGQPIIIENKAGASGQIGTQLVKNSPADGTVFLVNTDSSLTILPYIVADVPYSPARDFMMVGKIATLPWALSVPAANNIKNIAQFIDYIKQDPKRANYAVPTTGGVPEMIGEVIGKKAGVDMTILPYAGGAAIITSVLGAQISSGVTGTPEAFTMEKTGKAVVIGVSGTKRAAYLPNVPTFEESGLPGLTADSWFAVYAPKALPKPMAERFNVAMNNALKDSDTQKKIADMAIEVTTTNFAEAEKFYAEAITFWASVYKDKPKPAEVKK